MKTIESKYGREIRLFECEPKWGRHQTHDPASREYNGVNMLPGWMKAAGKPLEVPILWQRNAPIWNQGDVGSCTACAALGCLVSDPFYFTGMQYDYSMVEAIYSEETRIDENEIPGIYPPDDTGSSGLYSMKVLRSRGWITNYYHGFSLKGTIAMIQANGPVSIGLPWYDSMMQPNKKGLLEVSENAEMMGGHQVVGQGVDYRARKVRLANSWGPEWADKGYCDISFKTLDRLLHEGGDVVQPKVAR